VKNWRRDFSIFGYRIVSDLNCFSKEKRPPFLHQAHIECRLGPSKWQKDMKMGEMEAVKGNSEG
jgi:hypothetical protein